MEDHRDRRAMERHRRTYRICNGISNATLFNHDDFLLLKDASFGQVKLGECDVVVALGRDFPGARDGEIALQLENDEDGAFAADELLLFGLKRLPREAGCIARGLEAM